MDEHTNLVLCPESSLAALQSTITVAKVIGQVWYRDGDG